MTSLQESPDYQTCLHRGIHLLSLIASPSTAQSPWTEFASLEQQDWYPKPQQHNPEPAGLSHLFADPSLDLHRGEIHNHTVMTQRGEKEGIPNACFKNTYNVTDGLIVAVALKSHTIAAAESSREGLDEPAEDLRHWSDVTFLMWAFFSSSSFSPSSNGREERRIKRVVQSIIANRVTISVIEDVLEEGGRIPECKYPGLTFEAIGERTEGFAALLGTPNGMGTGWLVAEHRDVFPNGVRSISVWREAGEWFMGLNVG